MSSRNADKFIQSLRDIRAQGVKVEVRGDYLIWGDGRQERITDPRYWASHSEIQRRLGGQHDD